MMTLIAMQQNRHMIEELFKLKKIYKVFILGHLKRRLNYTAGRTRKTFLKMYV